MAKEPAVADVEVVIKGFESDRVRLQAQQMISHLAGYTDEPILHARVKITHSGDPARGNRAVTAQANVDINGRLMRAQITAPSAQEGLDLLQDVLQHRITRHAQHWEAIRGSKPQVAPHEWRHSTEHTRRPPYFPRPPHEREVVRRKAFELASCTPDEAIEDLELMGYDFQLFTDTQSDQDSVVYRGGPTGYRLAQLEPNAHHWVTAEPLSVSESSAPELDESEAIERLNLSAQPFLFYRDKVSRRGHVLYRRYDGHYGIVTPAA